VKTVKRKKTKAKSRPIARPALQHKSSIAFRRAWSLLGAVGYIFAVLVLFQFISIQLVLGFYEGPVPQNPVRISPVALEEKPQTNAQTTVGLPVRLKIPSLRVNAVIRYVGLTPNGSMGVPKLPRDTAWYMLGPKPGEKGSAVIAGHVNWWYGATGVFERLNALKPGDRIAVEDDQGTSTTFVVRKSRAYGQKEDASDVFRSYDGKSHLNLVTCDGVWDRASKAYSKRLVVFADKVVE
jgi:LPXTG-site transpeptidase (sortase) family protein